MRHNCCDGKIQCGANGTKNVLSIEIKRLVVQQDLESTALACSVEDQGDGTQVVQYCIERAGEYLLKAEFEGVPIHGSPFTLKVIPGTVDKAHCVLHGRAKNGHIEGVEGSFYINLADGYGNLAALNGDEKMVVTFSPDTAVAARVEMVEGTQNAVFKVSFTASGSNVKEKDGGVVEMRAFLDEVELAGISPHPMRIVSAELKKSLLVYGEIFDTERSYVKGLIRLVDGYKFHLQQESWIDAQQISAIFLNAEDILRAHLGVVHALNSLIDTWPDIQYGSMVQKSTSYVNLYTDFVTHFANSAHLVVEITNNSKWAAFVTRMNDTLGFGSLSELQSLLILPVQRLPRYKLLLDELCRNLPAGSELRARMEESAGLMEGLVFYLNEKNREMEHLKELRELESYFTPHFELAVSGRQLLMKSSVWILANNGMSILRILFLFNDILIIAVEQNYRYTVERVLEIHLLKVVLGQGRRQRLAFVILSPSESITCNVKKESERDSWIEGLTQAISKRQHVVADTLPPQKQPSPQLETPTVTQGKVRTKVDAPPLPPRVTENRNVSSVREKATVVADLPRTESRSKPQSVAELAELLREERKANEHAHERIRELSTQADEIKALRNAMGELERSNHSLQSHYEAKIKLLAKQLDERNAAIAGMSRNQRNDRNRLEERLKELDAEQRLFSFSKRLNLELAREVQKLRNDHAGSAGSRGSGPSSDVMIENMKALESMISKKKADNDSLRQEVQQVMAKSQKEKSALTDAIYNLTNENQELVRKNAASLKLCQDLTTKLRSLRLKEEQETKMIEEKESILKRRLEEHTADLAHFEGHESELIAEIRRSTQEEDRQSCEMQLKTVRASANDSRKAVRKCQDLLRFMSLSTSDKIRAFIEYQEKADVLNETVVEMSEEMDELQTQLKELQTPATVEEERPSTSEDANAWQRVRNRLSIHLPRRKH